MAKLMTSQPRDSENIDAPQRIVNSSTTSLQVAITTL